MRHVTLFQGKTTLKSVAAFLGSPHLFVDVWIEYVLMRRTNIRDRIVISEYVLLHMCVLTNTHLNCAVAYCSNICFSISIWNSYQEKV
jgi:hypothetical protein